MGDIIQLQKFLYRGLRSCELFDAVNVVMERNFLASSDLEISSLWMTPRSLNAEPEPGLPPTPASPVGVGLIVEMPRLELRNPNSLQRSLVVSIGVVEERNLNMTPSKGGAPGGTLINAEDWAELALDFMYAWRLNLSSGLTPESGTVKPAPDLIQGDGLVTYRAALALRREHSPTARCDEPAILAGSDPGTYVFANGAATPAADIYYMIAADAADLELPCKDVSDAVKWDGNPVIIDAGQVVNWCAWQAGRLPSHVSIKKIS